MSQAPTVHVDFNPEHAALTFDDTKGEPILAYQTSSSTGLSHPDGWVLYTADGDQWIVGSWDIDGVDEAVAKAKKHISGG